MERTTRWLIGIFSFIGVLHFAAPKPFEGIIPTPLKPYKRELVYASGVAELACAGLLAAPQTRRLGGRLSFWVILGVYPANLQMTLDAFRNEKSPLWYRILTLLRLPLQFPLLVWARRAQNSTTGQIG